MVDVFLRLVDAFGFDLLCKSFVRLRRIVFVCWRIGVLSAVQIMFSFALQTENVLSRAHFLMRCALCASLALPPVAGHFYQRS